MYISEYTRVFGKTSINSLPDTFKIEPLDIKDQGKNTDKCAFYAIASCFEEISNTVLDPDPTYYKAKVYNRNKGFRLSDAISFACENGFIEPNGRLFLNRFIKPFRVTGNESTFNNIKTTIFSSKKSLVCTAMWKPEWTYAQGGVVQNSINDGGEPHAFRILGWDERGLIIQNSLGKSAGDKGLFYFPVDVVNACFINSYVFMEVAEEESFTLDKFKKIVSSLLKCYNKKYEPSNS